MTLCRNLRKGLLSAMLVGSMSSSSHSQAYPLIFSCRSSSVNTGAHKLIMERCPAPAGASDVRLFLVVGGGMMKFLKLGASLLFFFRCIVVDVVDLRGSGGGGGSFFFRGLLRSLNLTTRRLNPLDKINLLHLHAMIPPSSF
jgi:hypothetical protein